jgi:hypothetical protein
LEGVIGGFGDAAAESSKGLRVAPRQVAEEGREGDGEVVDDSNPGPEFGVVAGAKKPELVHFE